MRDQIKKWWNRTWGNWEFESSEDVVNSSQRRLHSIKIYKKTSNDGLVKYKIYKV